VTLMLSHVGDGAVESCSQRRCRVLLVTTLLSPTSDSAAEVTLVAVRCRCRVMLVIVLLSHASDGAAEATWPRRDVDAESCWRQCCCVMLATTLSRRLGNNAM
jgi:hypothetical protein